MQNQPVELTRVIYNPVDQAFEALVTVHDVSGTRNYACSIHAPIDMEFSRAKAGLTKQALRRHNGLSHAEDLPHGRLLPHSIARLFKLRTNAFDHLPSGPMAA